MAIYVFKIQSWSSGEEQPVAIEAQTLRDALAEYEQEWRGEFLVDDWDIERITIERISSFSKHTEDTDAVAGD